MSKIIIRPKRDVDDEQIQSLHFASKLKYELPRDPIVSAIVEIDGIVRMAALLRKTSESYLLVDKEIPTRRDKLGLLLALHKELTLPMQRAGLTDTYCWLPPEMESFGNLLMNSHLGWGRNLWQSYHRTIE